MTERQSLLLHLVLLSISIFTLVSLFSLYSTDERRAGTKISSTYSTLKVSFQNFPLCYLKFILRESFRNTKVQWFIMVPRFRSGRAVLKHELPSTKHRWTALLSRIHMNTSKYKRDRRQFQIHLFKNNKSCSIQFHLYFSISSLSVVTTCTYRAILCNVVSWKQIYLCNTDTNICK